MGLWKFWEWGRAAEGGTERRMCAGQGRGGRWRGLQQSKKGMLSRARVMGSRLCQVSALGFIFIIDAWHLTAVIAVFRA